MRFGMLQGMKRAPSPAQSAAGTKYQRVREDLRKAIADGAYPPGERLPSESELHRQLGVSKNTVIRALNDLAREGLIVRRLGSGSFVMDPRKPPLVSGRFLRLGMLLPHTLRPDYRFGPVQRDIMLGAVRKWGMDGVEPVFPVVRDDEATRGIRTDEFRQCSVEIIGEEKSMATHTYHPPLEAVRAARFDGILAVSIVEQDWLTELLDLGVPTVLVDYSDDHFGNRADRVFFDPFPGYRATVRAMIARNLRRIHFVGCWMHIPHKDRHVPRPRIPASYMPENARPDPESFQRKAAWRQAMDEAGLPCPNEWSHFTWHSGDPVRVFAEQLASLPANERPEAIVCHALAQAEVFIDVFQARGLPLQAAGATSGQHRHTAWPIVADTFQLGDLAAEMLLRRIQQPSASLLHMGVPMVMPEFLAPPMVAGGRDKPGVTKVSR